MIKKLKVQNENEQYIIPIQEQIINKSKVKKKKLYIYISSGKSIERGGMGLE